MGRGLGLPTPPMDTQKGTVTIYNNLARKLRPLVREGGRDELRVLRRCFYSVGFYYWAGC
jgi:hypothetical protein